MSKERLEEINNFSSLPLKKRISLTKESIKKELKDNDYQKNININTQYLLEIIEQAERVQELEEEINDWRDEVKKWQKFYKESEESHLETKELLHSTSSAVKRYRQALEEILNADWNSEGLDAERELDKVTDVAFKALEGET